MADDSEVGSEPDPVIETESSRSRWRQYEATLRTRLETAAAEAESRRSDSRFYDTAFLVYERNRLLPASLLVGALASRIVIYLIPLLALVVFSFGLYADVTDTNAAGAATDAGLASIFASAADDSASANDGLRFAAMIATTVAVVYGAFSLGRLLRRSTALVWSVPYQRMERPWRLPLVVIGMSAIGWLLSALGAVSDEWSFEVFVGALVVELVGLVFLWLLVSRALPHDPQAVGWSPFLPGAFFVAGGVVALRVAMVVYFAPASVNLSERYGSIGAALVLLTWSYWLGMILVGSAEINAALFLSRKARRS